jgi:uncharacterized protein YndB with AHSA1/START domain
MAATIAEQTVHTLEIVKEEEIAAPIALVFEAILEQMGPRNEAPGSGPIPMRIEPWPGGRWYRDLGNNTGHLWGHVQAIKPPVLLEIYGPLFMSYAAISNVQYRLSEENGVTLLRFSHRAIAQISYDPQIAANWTRIEGGWNDLLTRIRAAAQSH